MKKAHVVVMIVSLLFVQESMSTQGRIPSKGVKSKIAISDAAEAKDAPVVFHGISPLRTPSPQKYSQTAQLTRVKRVYSAFELSNIENEEK